MKIRFCDECDASVPRADLEQGLAARIDGRLVCGRCLPKARRARLTRFALLPLCLVASAAIGAVAAVLLLTPRIENLEVRSRAAESSLAEAGRDREGLSGEMRGLRTVSAGQMEAIGDLRRAFENGSIETADLIRQVAGHAAGNGRQIRAVKELIARRIQAESEAAESGVPPPIPVLDTWLGLLGHEDPGVRLSALVALEGEEDERVTAALRNALADDDPAIRAQAALMAGRRRLAETLPALALLLEDESVHVRQAADQAFEAISGKDFGYDATDPEEERAPALAAIRAWLSREE